MYLTPSQNTFPVIPQVDRARRKIPEASGLDREIGPEQGRDSSGHSSGQSGNIRVETQVSTACFENASPGSHNRLLQTLGQGPHCLSSLSGRGPWVELEHLLS